MKQGARKVGWGLVSLAALAGMALVRCGGSDSSPPDDPVAGAGGSGAEGGAPDGVGGSSGSGGTSAPGGSATVGGSAGAGGAGGASEAGAGGEPLGPTPNERYGFVIDTLVMPTNANLARLAGFDWDDDDMLDNKFGVAMATFSGQGLAINPSIAEGIQAGETILLGDLRASSLTQAQGATFVTRFGKDPMPEPCLAGGDCGHHLEGTGSFALADSPPSSVCTGTVAGSIFMCQGGDLPVRLLLAGAPVEFTLHHARAELKGLNEDGFSQSRLGGTISETDVNEKILPAQAEVLGKVITAECGGPPPTCGCPTGTGAAYLGLFDSNDDCTISVEEVRNHPTNQALFAPDLDMDGDDVNESLSCGFYTTGKRATFDVP